MIAHKFQMDIAILIQRVLVQSLVFMSAQTWYQTCIDTSHMHNQIFHALSTCYH